MIELKEIDGMVTIFYNGRKLICKFNNKAIMDLLHTHKVDISASLIDVVRYEVYALDKDMAELMKQPYDHESVLTNEEENTLREYVEGKIQEYKKDPIGWDNK